MLNGNQELGNFRIGFLADTHDENYGLMRRAVVQMGKIDYLFHLGDFLNNFDTRPGHNPYTAYHTAAMRLKSIKEEFNLKGVYVIPGNHDVFHPTKGLCELEEFSLHEKTIQIQGYKFLGYGGGYNFVQMNGWDRFNNQRFRWDKKKLSLLLREGVDVLLLHQLDSRKESLRAVIEETDTKIVISGHTHKHGVEFYEKPMYSSCGPILPLDTRSHKRVGKSSYGILEVKDQIAKIELYFFNKEGNEDRSELDAEICINFRNH